MTQHDFSQLYAQYPTIIEQMTPEFTSHQFILKLAQMNQSLYIEALYDYRNVARNGGTAPFMMVHGVLIKRLHHYPKLIEAQGNVASKDVFDNPNSCAQWRKL